VTIRARAAWPAYVANFRSDSAGNPNAGACTLCRSSKVSAERPCVELGNNARPFREGMVVLCATCATTVGKAVGMLSPEREAELLAEVSALSVEVGRLQVELVAFSQLRGALDAMAASTEPADAT
jgi:hypothetical protein